MNGLGLFFAVILGCIVGFAFWHRGGMEREMKNAPLKPGLNTAIVAPLILPLYLVVLFAFSLPLAGVEAAAALVAEVCVRTFLHIALYYAVLLCLLPLLRRVLSAKACAALWVLPNMLYILMNVESVVKEPLLIITLPRQWLSTMLIVWLGGFAVIMLWQLVSHLVYRRRLLATAEPYLDAQSVCLWRTESKRHGIKREIPILSSELVSTPVTIGCFGRSQRLILPRGRRYSDQELELIFSHELRHIQRLDSHTKLFLGFCTAICWFNPLVWVARSKVSEDLELSCDESVLEGADEETRRRYAELLLSSAGRSYGCSTCLSASASSLRYRLKNVLKPGYRFPGSLAVGLAMCLLFMSVGTIAIAGSGGTVGECVFSQTESPPSLQFAVCNGGEPVPGAAADGDFAGEKALYDYLSSLRVRPLYTGELSFESEQSLSAGYSLPDGSYLRLALGEDLLMVHFPRDTRDLRCFILEEEPDWAYLRSLLY